MKFILSFLLLLTQLCLHSQQRQHNESAFRKGTWGVYSWASYNSNNITREKTPYIKGAPIILHWSSLEPQKGQFKFEEVVTSKLEQLDENDFNTFLMIWVAPAASGLNGEINYNNSPSWLFNNGVPLVEFPITIDPLGNETKRYFQHYLDEDYKFYFHRLIDEFGKYYLSLPSHLKERVIFVQTAEGSTGDGGPYKGEPLDSKYDISKSEWSDFRIETWKRYKAALSIDGELQVPLLTNNDANSGPEHEWMLESLPKAIGVKNGMFSHGYHISSGQSRLAEHIALRNEVEASGRVFFARGEQDAEYKTYGWSTQNIAQGLYWSALYATHNGLTMWNVPWEACVGETYSDAIHLFNRNAGKVNPENADLAFCAFRRGLDAADTRDFPESTYGEASKNNTQRYVKIAHALSDYGANQGDPDKATGGGMVNRKRQDYNDVGWEILTTNYQRHIYQIDPEETSLAWWQVDTTIYGRFARSFDVETGRNTMYFDVDDDYFLENSVTGSNRLKIKVIYRSDDPGSWALKYHAADSTMKTAMVVTNKAGQLWESEEIIVEDALLDNGGVKGADLILQNLGATNCRFHMIELQRDYDGDSISTSGVDGLSIYNCPPGEMPVNTSLQLEFDIIGESTSNDILLWTSSDSEVASVDEQGLVTALAAGEVLVSISTEDGAVTDQCSFEVLHTETTQLAYEGSNNSIPGLIEAEHFDTGGEGVAYHDNTAANDGNAGFRIEEGVDVANKAGASLGMVIAHPRSDEWTEYTVDIQEGYYDAILYYYCDRAHGDIGLSLNGVDLAVLSDIELQGDWDTRDSAMVKNLDLSGGENQILRLSQVDGGNVFLDAVRFVRSAEVEATSASITAYPSSALNAGETFQLLASLEPENATYPGVSWSSSDPEVASVDETGILTAIGEGVATITVRADSADVHDEITVEVIQPVYVNGLSLESCPEQELKVGSSHQLHASVSPANASNKQIVWSTDNVNVATVSSEGLVTALKEGQVSIMATSSDGAFTDRCDFVTYIPHVAVSGIELNDCPSEQFEIGKTQQLKASVLPEDATEKRVVWTSSDESVATVDENGNVVCVGEGTARIKVTTNDGGYTAECAVGVQAAAVVVSSVSIADCPADTLQVDSVIQLDAMVLPADADDQTISWSSSNEAIARVDASGTVTAVSQGEASISVTTSDGGFVDYCELVVDTKVDRKNIEEIADPVKIYPNPVKDVLHFQFKHASARNEIEISNAHGQILVRKVTNNQYEALNISKYNAEPILIVRVVTSDETFVRRFMCLK